MELLSKNKISYIKSLQQAKFRQIYRKFVVEGYKSVSVFLNSQKFKPELVVYTGIEHKINHESLTGVEYICNEVAMQSISNLVKPTTVLGVFEIIDFELEDLIKDRNPILLLDGIQDPGNCGTIIRTADWFGIKTILRTAQTADFYHPKVVQATMGSLNNIHFATLDDAKVLKDNGKKMIGMDMNGKDINFLEKENDLVIVLGSEGQGISKEIEMLCEYSICISGNEGKIAESLNVGVAASILLYQIMGSIRG